MFTTGLHITTALHAVFTTGSHITTASHAVFSVARTKPARQICGSMLMSKLKRGIVLTKPASQILGCILFFLAYFRGVLPHLLF